MAILLTVFSAALVICGIAANLFLLFLASRMEHLPRALGYLVVASSLQVIGMAGPLLYAVVLADPPMMKTWFLMVIGSTATVVLFAPYNAVVTKRRAAKGWVRTLWG